MNIIITSKKHPHYNEKGIIEVNNKGNVEIQKLITDTEMVKIILDNCPHGIKSCFAEKSDIKLI